MHGRTLRQMPDFDAYKALQVDPEADAEIIQAAYRRLARKYHPDLASDAVAAERMKTINAAWEILRDPRRRATYDVQRQARLAALGSAVTESPVASGISRPDRPDRADSADPYRHAGSRSDATSASREGQRRDRSSTAEGARGYSGRGTGPTSGHGINEGASRDWSSGRSSVGGGYDPSRMHTPEGYGAAGPPPGGSSGSVLNFGRYAGWSLGEIGRTDVEYLEWLDRAPIGRQYRDEIDAILRRRGLRKSVGPQEERRGLFRRR